MIIPVLNLNSGIKNFESFNKSFYTIMQNDGADWQFEINIDDEEAQMTLKE